MAAATQTQEQENTTRPAAPAGFIVPGTRDELPKRKKKQPYPHDFLAILAQYYGTTPDKFDRKLVPFLKKFEHIDPLPKAAAEPLVVQMGVDIQPRPVEIRSNSVITNGGLTMELALEMAILAKANPAMQNGVELTGNEQERQMLFLAAKKIGLKVLNPPAAARWLSQEGRDAKTMKAECNKSWADLNARVKSGLSEQDFEEMEQEGEEEPVASAETSAEESVAKGFADSHDPVPDNIKQAFREANRQQFKNSIRQSLLRELLTSAQKDEKPLTQQEMTDQLAMLEKANEEKIKTQLEALESDMSDENIQDWWNKLTPEAKEEIKTEVAKETAAAAKLAAAQTAAVPAAVEPASAQTAATPAAVEPASAETAAVPSETAAVSEKNPAPAHSAKTDEILSAAGISKEFYDRVRGKVEERASLNQEISNNYIRGILNRDFSRARVKTRDINAIANALEADGVVKKDNSGHRLKR